MTLTQLEAFALTLAIESAVAGLAATRFHLSPLKCAAAAVVGSTITHPILWAVYQDAYGYFGALTTPMLEAAVIAAETIGYRAIAARSWAEAGWLSLLANGASWAAGELIYALT